MPSKRPLVVGIDLGTTFCSVAYIDPGTSRPALLMIGDDYEEYVPSMVAVRDGEIVAGKAAYDKLLDHEAALITSDCRAHPNYQGCGDQNALLGRMLGTIRSFAKRLSAAGRCKRRAECWTESLKDQDSVVRQRAALELGRQGSSRALEALVPAALGEDVAVRLEALQSLEWLLANDAKARAQQAKRLSEFEVSLAHGKETVAGARFDAPLRRLIHRIRGTECSAGVGLGRGHPRCTGGPWISWR